MTDKTLGEGDSVTVSNAQTITLTNNGSKPAYVELNGDGIDLQKTVDAGATVTVSVHKNTTTVISKSKGPVNVNW